FIPPLFFNPGLKLTGFEKPPSSNFIGRHRSFRSPHANCNGRRREEVSSRGRIDERFHAHTLPHERSYAAGSYGSKPSIFVQEFKNGSGEEERETREGRNV